MNSFVNAGSIAHHNTGHCFGTKECFPGDNISTWCNKDLLVMTSFSTKLGAYFLGWFCTLAMLGIIWNNVTLNIKLVWPGNNAPSGFYRELLYNIISINKLIYRYVLGNCILGV